MRAKNTSQGSAPDSRGTFPGAPTDTLGDGGPVEVLGMGSFEDEEGVGPVESYGSISVQP